MKPWCVGVGVAALLASACHARAQEGLPQEFQGDWVPASATCDSPARFIVTATRMNLVNGADAQSYGDLAIAHTFFGPDYQGISVVCVPEFNSSNPPFTVYFNADEQKGSTKLEIYKEMKGPGNPQGETIQADAKKLAERFPLNDVPLKKCSK
jgi:hypothetical protein